MKTLVLAIVITSLAASTTSLQQKSEPQFKLVEFYMALLKKGPNWSGKLTPETKQLHDQHFAYATSLLDSGKVIIAGPVSDDPELRGIYVFRAPSPDEAKAWAYADPAVKAGHFVVEMHSWWSEDIFRKANLPIKFTQTYLAFLTRGDKWTPEKTPQTEEIQKAHLANINRLAGMKKLVAAGPFGDDGNLRGTFVFRVASLEEAQTLANTDPAVKAGRLKLELHLWMVPEGVIP